MENMPDRVGEREIVDAKYPNKKRLKSVSILTAWFITLKQFNLFVVHQRGRRRVYDVWTRDKYWIHSTSSNSAPALFSELQFPPLEHRRSNNSNHY